MDYTGQMKRLMLLLLGAGLLCSSAWLYAVDDQADEAQADDDGSFSTDGPSAEELEGAEMIPIELDKVSVSGMGMEFKQEVTLRIIRQAYGASRSERRADRDKWICWLDKPTGTHFKHMSCARNGDLEALRPDSLNPLGTPQPNKGYGKIIRTTRTVNRAKLEATLRALPGSDEFDREFVNMVMMGEKPPRDVPNDEEVEQFASAWIAVRKLHRRRKPENVQIQAIEEQGLTLERYNRIAELTETFQSVENQVAKRVKELR